MPSLNLTADASSVFNLVNSGVAEVSLSDLESVTRLTPQVASESKVKSDTGFAVKKLIKKKLLEEESEIVGYQELEDFILSNALGAGECETILSCSKTGRTVCCDDKKARNLALKMLGSERIIGSIGLLRKRVLVGALNADEAYEAYENMVACGGFLPKLSNDFFEKGKN